MGWSVVVDLPDEVYYPLERRASHMGRSPAEWLADVARQLTEDPLEGFIGSLASDVPDWAERHDEYLGAALAREMRGGAGDGGDNK